MAASTVSIQEVLFKVARDANEVVAEFVTSASSTTVFIARGILRDPHVSYKTALAKIEGKGIRAITAWDPSTEQITVASAFDTAVAASDIVEVIGWDATRRKQMLNAVNDAIRVAFPWWWRETVVDAATSAITLATATDVYNLPTDISALLALGIQPSANDPIKWWHIKDAPDWFAVEGQEGAFQVRFAPRFNREGGFHQVYTGKKLCTKYATREPEVDSESDTTQLVMGYFVVASAAYKMRMMGFGAAGADGKAQAGLDAQQYALLAQMAQTELQKLLIAKVPPNPLVVTQSTDESGQNKRQRSED